MKTNLLGLSLIGLMFWTVVGASAQGVVNGVSNGAERGDAAAGPVGAVVGGIIGGVDRRHRRLAGARSTARFSCLCRESTSSLRRLSRDRGRRQPTARNRNPLLRIAAQISGPGVSLRDRQRHAGLSGSDDPQDRGGRELRAGRGAALARGAGRLAVTSFPRSQPPAKARRSGSPTRPAPRPAFQSTMTGVSSRFRSGAEHAHRRRGDRKMLPFDHRKSYPSGAEHGAEVAVREQRDIALHRSETSDHPVYALADIGRRFAVRATVAKDVPPWTPLANLGRAEAFEVAVAPLGEVGFNFCSVAGPRDVRRSRVREGAGS